jgi:hypothetical protein
MNFLRICKVYLDIFLKLLLLWSMPSIAKLVILVRCIKTDVRCIKTSTNYLFDFLTLAMSQLRSTSLRIGISVGHQRGSSGRSSARKNVCGIRLSPW